MAIKKLSIHNPGGKEVTPMDLILVQNQIASVLDELLRKPIASAILLKNIELDSSITNNIPHNLGRKPINYIVGKQNVQADIWFDTSSTIDQNIYLPLKCSVDVKINIEVY